MANLLKTAKNILAEEKVMMMRKEKKKTTQKNPSDHSLHKCIHILLYFIQVVNSNKVWNNTHMLNTFCFNCVLWRKPKPNPNLKMEGEKNYMYKSRTLYKQDH